MPKRILVIAAYNEAAMIEKVVASVVPLVDEVIVVNDGSKDQTALLAKKGGALVVSHPINRGQGSALQTGMEMALFRGADVIIHFDADGQHPAHQIDLLVKPVLDGQADVVVGSRFLDQTSNVPPTRRVVLKMGALFTRLMSGLEITDPHSGFRALSREAAQKLQLHQDRMAHASELLQLVARHELRFREIPVTIAYTDYSKAKGQSSLAAFKIVADLIKGAML